MNVYAVISAHPASIELIQKAVTTIFADNYLKVNDACWFVADSGDIRAFSLKLGVVEGPPNSPVPVGHIPNVIVLWAISYWGNASVNIWAWMVQKQQQQLPSANV